MFTIGLLGGIASGKSRVAQLLVDHGAAIIDADQAAHEALDDAGVRQALRQRWGDDPFDSNGMLVRRKVAERVFGAEPELAQERRFLEGLIHPKVRQLLTAELAELASQGQRVVVLDIPLLIEAGWAKDCDLLIFVDAPEAARRERAAKRGWDRNELSWREAAQLPIKEKRAHADVVIENGGDQTDLSRAVAATWNRVILPNLEG